MQIIFKDMGKVKEAIEESIHSTMKTYEFTLEGTGVSVSKKNMWHSHYVRCNGVDILRKVKSRLREE